MNNKKSLAPRVALLFAVVLFSGCASHLPKPPLVIPATETTYIKVVPAKQIVRVYMTPITIAGAAGAIVNQNTEENSNTFYSAIRDNPRTQALQTRFRDQVIQQAKASGLNVQNGDGLPDATSERSDQIIYLRGFEIVYQAKTIMHSYSPLAATFIESSRDPLIPAGKTRLLRLAKAEIDDRDHSFVTAASVVENREVALEGVEMAVDALAVKVAAELSAARQP